MPYRNRFTAACHTMAFPAGLISPNAVLEFTTDDLAHALFATGRAPGDEVRHGWASVWEFVHRVSLIPAYVRRTDGGALVKSALARELDRSEKVTLSYSLGQALTGIFCERKLGVTHLLHMDRYASRWAVTFAATRKRADLFGLAADGWVVAEAKGRSNGMEADLPNTLVAQKRSVKSIAGERPWLALGCVAAFPPHRYELSITAVDPDEEGPEPIDVDLDLDRYMLTYYEPFLAAIAAGTPEVQDERYLTSRFGMLNLRVGLRREIAARVRQASQGELSGLYDSVAELLDAGVEPDEAATAFPDGTLVATDWTDDISLNDWRF
ncbi:hypothetical protein [Micromonospora sp. 4G55]|uniref:hypothetical protein n=1 Tax=Micromonospora sp. 4G55 TaxID=2806102 RepID=UPI001A4672DE|nr:hypothetical protein [Micromonospora sp. 4G55]MBM0256308.1 hypothetical protein [Micromonospora sp. 4G55]